jgi:hypothetical protein
MEVECGNRRTRYGALYRIRIGPSNPSSGGTTGLAPGVNTSNPQAQTNRNNANDLTKPGGSNPQDLKR